MHRRSPERHWPGHREDRTAPRWRLKPGPSFLVCAAAIAPRVASREFVYARIYACAWETHESQGVCEMSNVGAAGRPAVAVIGGGYAGFNVSQGQSVPSRCDLGRAARRSSTMSRRYARLSSPSGCRESFSPTTICSSTAASYVTGQSQSTRIASRSVPVPSLRRLHRAPHRLNLSLSGKSGTDETATALRPLPREPRRTGAGGAGVNRWRRADCLELAGEISDRWPENRSPSSSPSPRSSPAPTNRNSGERFAVAQERGPEFVLGEALAAEPESPPVT